jgi:gluconokinase
MVIALDVGTSSARAAAYDRTGRRLEGGFHGESYDPVTTRDGGMEHDPARLLDAVGTCLDAVLGGGRESVLAVGVSTFWHGLCGFDAGHRPVTPIYMWADTRSTPDVERLRATVDADALHARTGCPLHSTFWPAKLRWLARTRPADFSRVAHWGSFGEYLEAQLFGDAGTSVSMASATGLLDGETARWDTKAVALAGIDESRLLPLTDRTERRQGLRTSWARRWPALSEVPWFPAVGDGAASSVGSGCVTADRVALNVGTSAALRIVTPSWGAPPPRALWRYRVDRDTSIVGGATSEGGNVFAWCEQTLRLPDPTAVDGALAAMEPDAHGLTVLPFLAGERAPGWRGDVRAAITGLSMDTGPLDILRASLEAVALRLALVYDALAPLAAPGHAVVASGGAIARSRVWTQMMADALGRPLRVSRETEATSRGAAVLALGAAGAARSLETPSEGDTVTPDPGRHARYREALARQRRLEAELDRLPRP